VPDPSAPVQDGEWVVVVVEVGAERRATSAAARVAIAPDGPKLVFEPRDWATLAKFARWEARRSVSFPPTLREGREPLRAKKSGERGAKGEAKGEGKGEAKGEGTAAVEGSVAEITAEGHDGGAKVLLVDDDPDIREVLSAMLASVGLSVTPVGNAEEALEHVAEERVDLVILDWSLPAMTGLDLCRMLRGRAALESMPIVFLSANALTQDIDEAFASGADDYVVKPFRAPELGARIWSLLRRAELSPTAR
jgi:two-component system phosphate regulon response regulator PhoB